LYPTGDEYLPVICKWLESDPGVLSELSKYGQKMFPGFFKNDVVYKKKVKKNEFTMPKYDF